MRDPIRQDFEGRTVLVTGAARGIGLAIARRFGADGALVLINDRSHEGAEAAAQGLQAEGLKAQAAPGDVSDESVCRGLVSAAVMAGGGLDVIVNNAATGRSAAIADHTPEHWNRVLSVNLVAPFLLAKAGQASLAERRGSIVNIASAAAYGMVGQCSYDASKGGLISLTRSLALEMGGTGVRVNSVCPGFVDTEMLQASPTLRDNAAKVARGLPISRFARPDEIAEAVFWLASDEASYVTGHALFVDGGWIRP